MPNAQEIATYSNAPRERLMADLQGAGYDAYTYGQQQQEMADRFGALESQLQSGVYSDQATQEIRDLAAQEYDPYYQRLQTQQKEDLDYVLNGIKTGRIRSKEDLQNTLQDIAKNQMFYEKNMGLRREGLTAQQTAFERQAPQQMRQMQQGYSNRGLLYSGEKDTGQGNLEFAQQQQRQGYERQGQAMDYEQQQQMYGYGRQREQARTGYQRGLEDYNRQAGRYQTQYDRSLADLKRQKTYDIESYLDKERQRRERDFTRQQMPEAYYTY
jgi:hypothetical protein